MIIRNKKGKLRGLTLCLVLVLMTIMAVSCGSESETQPQEENTELNVPEIIADSSFVYDELEIGEGDGLYTLNFSENGYTLYQDGGVGVLSKGTIKAAADKTLEFDGQDENFDGAYKGSAFEEVAVTINWDGKTMDMSPATETSEYVHLSYLGVYQGMIGEKSAVLILDRWFEYYLYYDNAVHRGTYEIYSDKSVEFTPYEGLIFNGSLSFPENQDFELSMMTLEIDMGETGSGSFALADKEASYEAAHAMGAYTLSIYKENIFVIHGTDGFVKSMGTIEMEDGQGKAVYFPRKITGEAENEERGNVSFTYEEGTLFFPETTPLLPRSGNIDEETGIGEYWTAGTKLEFIENSEIDTDLSEGIVFAEELVEGAVSGGNFPEGIDRLDQVMPSIGTSKPLAIMIDFPDFHRPRHVEPQGIEEALFSLEKQDSLSAYYYRSSYGNLVIDGDVLGWYRAKLNRDEYESDTELMAEAINYYIDEGLDLSEYDADKDGRVDSLIVLWAGNLSGSGGMWDTAYRSTWRDSPGEWNTEVTGYIFVPGSTVWSMVPPLVCNTNSLIHETGHLLGLNDYYSYDTSKRSGGDGTYTGGALEGGFAGMDMMDANIGDHNVFSKWLLGWIEPTVVEYDDIKSLNEQRYELRPSSVAGDALFIKLKDSESMYTEMLVVEVVSPVGNASEYTRLTQPVVRIFHVDSSLATEGETGGWRGFGFAYDNSYTSTKYISTIEADGEDEFLNFVPSENGYKSSYSEEDYFTAGDVLASDTYPNTNAYDELGNASIPTGLSIEIEEIKEDGTAVIALSYQELGEVLTLTEISPKSMPVPYTEEEETMIPADTKEILFTYSAGLNASAEALQGIKVYSDHSEVEGVSAEVEENRLKVLFENGVEKNHSYTVVIPKGILSSADNSTVTNNYNGIYGFLVEK